MPGENLAGGESDLSISLAALEAKINGLEKSGQWWPGMIAWTAAASAPAGFLIADGSTFDTARYAALAVIFPSGVLPDLQGRMPLGAGPGFALLSTGGASAVTLTGAQSGMPAHMHTIAAATGSTTPGATGGPSVASTGAGTAHAHTVPAAFSALGFGWTTTGGTSGFLNTGTAQATSSESAHTHSMQSHTHTSAAHTHTLPDTDTTAAANAAASHSILNPYVALTPLIHI